MFDDYIVDYKHRDNLQVAALEARLKLNSYNHNCFCPYLALKKLEGVEIPGKGKVFLHVNTDLPKSYVQFSPRPNLRVDVYIDHKTWLDMKAGDPQSRLMGAHELGHILLHNHGALGFHGTAAQFAMVHGEERSAEWQAIHFAMFVLISDEAIFSRRSETEISIDYRVPIDQVRDRVVLFEKMNKIAYQEWRSKSCEITF